MTEQAFRALIEKYFKGTLSKSEAAVLREFEAKIKANTGTVFVNEKQRAEIKYSIYAKIQKSQKRTYRKLWRVAASIVVLIGLSTTIYHYSYTPIQEEHILLTQTTARGEKLDVTLPDGTQVKLNAGSSITYPETFDGKLRSVALKGEAFFEVIKNPNKPFEVHTGELKTTVLGTSFNINTHDSDNITVTVASGKVGVAAKSSKEVVLTPKQQLSYNKISHQMSSKEVKLEKYLDWKDGILRFENTSISEAGKKLERWYDVDIEVLNQDIGNCRFTGTFNNEELSTILESLSYLKSHMEYRILENNKIEVKGRCN